MPAPRPRRDDGGFTLVEVVVAAVVLSLALAAIAGVLVQSLDLSRDNAQRVQAASVARAQLEAVRSADPTTVADGAVDVGITIVQGTSYSVRQTATFLTASSTTSACAGTGQALAYKRVTVSVSWPAMGTTNPVRADTLLALTAAQRAQDSTTASVAIGVNGYDGSISAPLDGAVVMIAGLSQTTGEDGCAVFRGLPPGNYATSVSRAGYVDVDGRTSTPGTAVATAGTLVRPAAVLLGQAGRLRTTITVPPGYTPLRAVATLPVTLDTSRFSPQTFRTFADCSTVTTSPAGCVSGFPRGATQLFPAAYGVTAGDCALAPPNGQSAVVPPGGAADVTVPLAGVTVRLGSGFGTGSSVDVTVTSSSRNGCPASTSTLSGVTRSGTRTALPSGTWTLTRPAFFGFASVTRTVVLDGTAAPVEVEL